MGRLQAYKTPSYYYIISDVLLVNDIMFFIQTHAPFLIPSELIKEQPEGTICCAGLPLKKGRKPSIFFIIVDFFLLFNIAHSQEFYSSLNANYNIIYPA